jgi:hypothetical protein
MPDAPAHDTAPIAASPRKPQSSKHFLMIGAATLALCVGVLGVVGLGAWLARNELATGGLNAFLRSKGIAGDVTIKNLQLDTAQISQLRLGPGDKPSLLVENANVKWRLDSKAGLVIIEQLAADGVTLRLSVDKDGTPDFGALAPFMKPSTGPKRSVINNVSVTNATLLLDTPLGQAISKLRVTGGEAQGWTGAADIMPPASLIAKDGATPLPFDPLRIGFAYKQVAGTGTDAKPITQIGFAVRPNGQSLTYLGYQVRNLVGDVTGQVSLQDGGAIRIDTRVVNLAVARALGPGFDVTDLNTVTNPIFWTHTKPWQTTGWGNVVASGSFKKLVLARANLKAGPSRFRLGAARAESGRLQLDYQGDVRGLSGPISGQRIVAAGGIATKVDDLTQFGKAEFTGKSQITGAGINLPAALKSNLPPTLPQAVWTAVQGTFSGSGAFDYQITQAQSRISLNGPLIVTGSTGLRASFLPQGRTQPTVLIKPKRNGTFDLSAMASGRTSFNLPNLGNVQGTIDAATYGRNGWALIGRDLAMNAVALTPTLSASLSFDRLNLQGPSSGAINGRGAGQIKLGGGAASTANLAFDLVGSTTTMTGTVRGPIEGFGTTLGLGGYGARAGRLDIRGVAQKQEQGWRVDGRGQLDANALVTNAVSLTAPSLWLAGNGNLGGGVQGRGRNWAFDGRGQLTANALKAQGLSLAAPSLSLGGKFAGRGQNISGDGRGQLAANALTTQALSFNAPTLSLDFAGQLFDQGNLDARAQFSGTAAQARPASQGRSTSLSGLTVIGNGAASGPLKRLTMAGNLETKVGRANGFDLQLDQARSSLQFAGTISPSSAQFRGTNALNLATLRSGRNGPSGQVSVAGARASGPFSFAASGTAAKPAFWDGRLTFISDLTLGLDQFQAGTTRLVEVDLALPLTASLNPNRSWQASGRLKGQTQTATLAGTTFSNLMLTGPFATSSTNGGWQATGDVDVAAARLTSGETRLIGVTANGPLGVTSVANGNLRVSSAQCLSFAARSGTFPGDASVSAVSGKLCPDAKGQIAAVSSSGPQLSATTELDPLTIQIGDVATGQSLDLGDITGTIVTKPDGGLRMEMLATQFGFTLKLPDGNSATIKANEAALDIIPQTGGIGLKGRIGRVSSIGLPVLMSGGANADLIASPQGLGGTFAFDDIILKDAEKSVRFGELRLVGSGTLAGNQVSILSDVLEPASEIKMATVMLSHDIASGSGNLDLTARDLLFSPRPVATRPGLDIVTLIPPLRGVVSDMVGVANASANLAWSRTTPIVSRANIETKGLDFGTMLGPITGFAGDIKLDDILLVRTAGRQTIKVGLFDPGLPIENGTVQFVLPGNNSLRLEDASWPFAEGKLSVRPATWAFRDGDQSFSIDVEDVDLAKLLRLTDVPNLEIDGKVSGVFPIEVREGNVEIVGGRLKAREGGGVIRYTGPNPSPPPPPPGFFARMRQRVLGKAPPAGADLAIEALRALEYKILEITVDGRITGELQMGVVLEGANQQVLSGQPFKFNVKMNVPVGQLLDNLNRLNNMGSSPEVLKEVDRVMREEAAKKAAMPPTPAPAPAPTSPPPTSPAP